MRVLLTCVAALALAAMSVAAAHAGEPPTPTPTPNPNEIRLRVVSDLNGDGLAQAYEPGIAGVTIRGGCGDAFQILTTDADGYAATFGTAGFNECFTLQRQFGWLPTTPLSVRVDPANLDPSAPTLFLLHDLGNTVTEVSGEVIVDGLPAVQPTIGTSAPPFDGASGGCVEHFVGEVSGPTLIVVGADQRAGCPTPGAHFGVIVNGVTLGDFAFQPGATTTTSFVIGGDSMRFFAVDVDGARVIDAAGRTLGADCAVVRPVIGGFTPPDYVRVFVLSEEVRAGCGAPGRRVVALRDGQPLAPVLDWRAGSIDLTQPFELAPPPVTPPNTGNGAAETTGSRSTILAALLLFSAGIATFAAWRRVRWSQHL